MATRVRQGGGSAGALLHSRCDALMCDRDEIDRCHSFRRSVLTTFVNVYSVLMASELMSRLAGDIGTMQVVVMSV